MKWNKIKIALYKNILLGTYLSMAEQQKLTDVKVLLLDPREDDAQNLPTFQ